MITVVGGTYVEHCMEPAWDHLLGSGGRAAFALAGASDKVTFHTYIEDALSAKLHALADAYGVTLARSATPTTPSFSYQHPLSVPEISPDRSALPTAPPLAVTADVVLRFGMLEGDGVVTGGRVVYDPQSPVRPQRYRQNGSTAKQLAIVCNRSEAAALSGIGEPEQAAQSIIAAEGADVVVVKCGAAGALVAPSAGSPRWVPSYRADLVFSIGSGDMFAAAFAHFWAERNQDPLQAADLASRATADYCESRSMSIASSDDLIARDRRPVTWSRKRVYLAGPFFSISQRWLVEEARRHLIAMGMDVFSPLHDVGRGDAAAVVHKDIDGIKTADCLFALLDGIDAGTVFEVGYARALDKPVIALAQAATEEQLKMMVGTGCEVIDDFATAVYRTAWLQRP